MTKQLTLMPIDDLKPYERNPRYNDMAVDAVKESIKQCEYIAPIIVDEENVILAGHTRYKALKEMDVQEVEVLKVTGMTTEQKKKYRLLDNKTSELAEWNLDFLDFELEEIDFGDFDFGFEFAGNSWELLEDAGWDGETTELRDFSITFVFPKEEEETVKGYIKKNGKQELTEMILRKCKEAPHVS